MNLARRPATESDIPFLLQLRRESMGPHLMVAAESTSAASHLSRLMYLFECCELVLWAGTPVGMLKVTRDGPDWTIVQIQVKPHAQGKGLGAALVAQVISEAAAVGANLSLSVLKANPARAMYTRLGFVVESESAQEYTMRYSI